jgi:hypothetical protein
VSIKVWRQAATLSIVVAMTTPAWAQAPAAADPSKPQVQTFEMVLRNAVQTGGQNFARWASQISPDIASLSFAPGESPVVSGIADHQLGLYVFQVQVPGVSLLSVQTMNMIMSGRQFPAPRPSGSQPVNNPRVTPGGIVTADPNDAPVEARPDFLREYASQVRDALIDAIIDNSVALPITANETLLVYAGGIDPVVADSLLRSPSRKLVLKAKGGDLLSLRQGVITRDEAKRRVLIGSF